MTALNTDDRELLSLYARTRSADAFAELVRRYTGMVYAVARRVTGSSVDAEDVCQTCFMELAVRADRVDRSVGGWLHATATSRAMNMIEAAGTRRRHERQHAWAPAASADLPQWEQIEPLVDRAIADLPDDLREPLVLHYLNGISQMELASRLGVNQSTISRRIERGVAELRELLSQAGVGVPTAALGGMLSSQTAAQAPASLVASLAKIGLAGVQTPVAHAAASLTILAKLVMGGITAIVTLVGVVIIYQGRTGGTMATQLAPATRPVAGATGYSDIRLTGFGMRQDSVSLALQAAARAMGKQADYERLYGLSGNAFAPAIDVSETCCSWWHVQARMGTQNLPTMASSVGLAARWLGLPVLKSDATDQQKEQARAAAAVAVRKEMADGAMVVTEGGWDEVGAWNWSGVVTSVDDDGTMRGACLSAETLDGRTNVAWKYPGALWSLRPANQSTPDREATLAMLRAGVARIRGTGAYASQGSDLYGLAAMDKWISQMRTVRGFCGSCFANAPVTGVQDAPDNDSRMYEAAMVAARELRRAAGVLPVASRPHLASAAGAYEHVARLLEPAATVAAGVAIAGTESITLRGRAYRLEWVTPGRLSELHLSGAAVAQPRSADGPYAGHVNPLYNIHCELAPDLPQAPIEQDLKQRNITWQQYWEDLARRLPDRPFAIVAFDGERLAGYARFFAGDVSQLRQMSDQQGRGTADLIIGAAAVDQAGADDGLDAELVRRMVHYAHREGYQRIQAIGWSDVPAYALWGESLPASLYASMGFASQASTQEPAPLLDMLRGSHGELVRQAVDNAVKDLGQDVAARIQLMALDVGRLPALPPGGTFGYDSLSSLAAQEQYAQTVLVPIKDQLEWAAIHMERAAALAEGAVLLSSVLAASDALDRADAGVFPGRADMRTQTDVQGGRLNTNPLRSDMVDRLICTRAAGITNVDYETLVMLAGWGTSFAFHPNRFDLYGYPDGSEATESRLAKGSGLAMHWQEKVSGPDAAWSMIHQTIDAGRPLQANWLDDFVIAGYQDAPVDQDRKVYVIGGWGPPRMMSWQEFAEWSRNFGRLAIAEPMPGPRDEQVRTILERTVAWATADGRAQQSWMTDGLFGLAAMEAYADFVADAGRDLTTIDDGWLGCHCIKRQATGRRCAAVWLDRIAEQAPATARPHLRRAAASYREAYASWQDFGELLGSRPGDNGPDNAQLKERWRAAESRLQGAAAVRKATGFEEEALRELEQSLRAWGS